MKRDNPTAIHIHVPYGTVCVPDGSEVYRGIPVKVALVDGTCGIGIVVNVGAVGRGSILVF